MGVRDDHVLDRACDLGLAFQLTNIARDVIDDAAIGRSYLPGDWVRDSVNQRVYESGKRVLGMNASWTVSKQTRLVLNLDHLVPRTRSRIDAYLGAAEIVWRTTDTSNHARVAIRLETRL